ncbi:MAG: FecR family protein [Anaerolineae bacterium]|nr:FecR family protein [Anaerolineae bacterium]
MRDNPERLAWIILFISFFICIALAVSVPLGIRYYLLHAQVVQRVALEVQRPPLSIRLPGRELPLSVTEHHNEVPERTLVTTAATAGRLVCHAPKAESPIIAIAQLYDQTSLLLLSARSPRFALSKLPHQVNLEVQRGRVRITVANENSRATVVEVRTPYGMATLTEGTYWINVGENGTEITVREGHARLTAWTDKGSLTLGPEQRAVIDSEQWRGPLPAARNLVVNSNFALPLEHGWTSYSKDIQIDGEPGGEVLQTEMEGRPAVVIERRGEGHAETGITQHLGVDVRDFSLLQLHLLLYIDEHNVPVCGYLGSECPIMVRIDYKDYDGTDQQWLQGFYAVPDTATPGNPPFCVTCGIRNDHIRVPADTWYSYDSENLVPQLSQLGRAPAQIKSITVYASGHTYRAAVAEIELIGQE